MSKQRWWGISRKRWDDERRDALGDRGRWEDQDTLSRLSYHDAGRTTQLNRMDGSSTGYRYVGSGWRVIPGTDTPPTVDMNDPHRGTPQQNATNWRGEAEYYERQATMNRRTDPEQADHDAKNAATAARIAEVKDRYPDVDVMGPAEFEHEADTAEGLRERARTMRAAAEIAEVADPLKGVEFTLAAADMERAAADIEANEALADAAAEFEKAQADPKPEPEPEPVCQPNPPPTLPPPPRQPPPTPPPTTPPSGADMSGSIGDAATGIRGANDAAGEATGILQQGIAQVEAARGQMMAAAAGSAQADVSEASALFGRAIESIEEAQKAVQAAIAAAASVADRL